MSYLVNDHRIDLNHQFIWCPNNLHLSLEWYFESHWCKGNYDIIIKLAKELRKKKGRWLPRKEQPLGLTSDLHPLYRCELGHVHPQVHTPLSPKRSRQHFPCACLCGFPLHSLVYKNIPPVSQMFSNLPATAQPSAHLELISRSHDSHFLSFLLLAAGGLSTNYCKFIFSPGNLQFHPCIKDMSLCNKSGSLVM